MGLLDLFFPKYCVACKKLGQYICDACFARLSFDVPELCLVCDKPAISGITHPVCKTSYAIDGSFSGLFYNKTARKLLYAFKYKPYVSDLSEILGQLLHEALLQKETYHKVLLQKPFFVPIPLHSSRFRQRGYNQAKIIAQELAKREQLVVYELLSRVKKTTSQVGKTKKDREENIKGAFSLVPNILVSLYPNILLIDDVLTSGATFLEAAKILKKAGAKQVWGVSLFRD